MSKHKSVKLTVNIPSASFIMIQRSAQRQGITMTEEIHKILGIYEFLENEVLKGGKILVHEKNGKFQELIWE